MGQDSKIRAVGTHGKRRALGQGEEGRADGSSGKQGSDRKKNQKKNIMGKINRLGGGDCEVNT